MRLDTPVTQFPGIGPARGEKLEKLGIRTAKDLVAAFPRDYEDRRTCWGILNAPLGEKVCVGAMAAEHPRLSRVRKGMDLVKLRAVDGSGTLHITFFNQSTGTADCCFRRYMTDGSTTGCTGEAAICDQSHGRTKTHTCNCRGGIQHFTHTGSSLGTFVTDYHHITCYNLAALDCFDCIFFAFEDTRRTFMYQHFFTYCRTFYNTAIRRDISL